MSATDPNDPHGARVRARRDRLRPTVSLDEMDEMFVRAAWNRAWLRGWVSARYGRPGAMTLARFGLICSFREDGRPTGIGLRPPDEER